MRNSISALDAIMLWLHWQKDLSSEEVVSMPRCVSSHEIENEISEYIFQRTGVRYNPASYSRAFRHLRHLVRSIREYGVSFVLINITKERTWHPRIVDMSKWQKALSRIEASL